MQPRHRLLILLSLVLTATRALVAALGIKNSPTSRLHERMEGPVNASEAKQSLFSQEIASSLTLLAMTALPQLHTTAPQAVGHERRSRMFRCLPLTLVCVALALNPCTARGDLAVYTSRPDFVAVTGATQVVDFDLDVSDNTVIDLQYDFLGLDFNPFNGGTPATRRDPSPSGFNALSAPNQVQTVNGTFAGGGGLEVVFSPPVAAVGLFLGDVQFPGSTLSVRSADGEPFRKRAKS
jgi:hypothetical protein